MLQIFCSARHRVFVAKEEKVKSNALFQPTAFLEEGVWGVDLCLRHVPLTNGQEESYGMTSKSFISLKSVRETNNRNWSKRQARYAIIRSRT